jgi:hypothetical protein
MVLEITDHVMRDLSGKEEVPQERFCPHLSWKPIVSWKLYRLGGIFGTEFGAFCHHQAGRRRNACAASTTGWKPALPGLLLPGCASLMVVSSHCWADRLGG